MRNPFSGMNEMSTHNYRLQLQLNRPKTYSEHSSTRSLRSIHIFKINVLWPPNILRMRPYKNWKYILWVIFHWVNIVENQRPGPSSWIKHYLCVVNSYHNTFVFWKGWKNGMREMCRIIQTHTQREWGTDLLWYTKVRLDKIEICLYLGKCFMNVFSVSSKYPSFPIDKFSVRCLRRLHCSTVASVPTHWIFK